MIRAILFDLSDVLVTGLTGIEASLQPLLNLPGEEILRQFRSGPLLDFLLGECSEETYLGRLRHEYGWQPSVEQLKATVRQHFKTPIPGAGEMVAGLAVQYPLYLISDHGREWVQFIEAEHAFLGLFTRRFYSFNLHMRKNNPDLFREVLQQAGLEAGDCLYIDDRPVFLEAARQAGLPGIRFESHERLKGQLRDHGAAGDLGKKSNTENTVKS